MELLLIVLCIILALGFVLDKATDLVKILKSEKSLKLNKGFEAKVSVSPINNSNQKISK